MKRILTIALAAWLVSCGGNSSKHPNFAQGNEPGAKNGNGDGTSSNGDDDKTNNSSNLELLTSPGSLMRLMSAPALTVFYSHVFTQNKFGYVICQKTGPRSTSFCHDSIFDASERAMMGTFYVGNGADFGIANVNRPDNLTLNYMRSLRSGLGRECQALVDREYEAFKGGDVSKNLLIKSAMASPADLDFFFRRILGIEKSKIAVDSNSAEYAKAFATVAADGTEANVKKAFEAVCVAIAMDPKIIFY